MFLFFLAFSLSLKPIYLVGGFANSPVYGTVTNPSLYPECPADLNKVGIRTPDPNTQFINQYPDCVAKLLRVQINSTTGEVEQLPGMITDSSPIGPSTLIGGTFPNIISKAKSKGYVDNETLFSVGYNYFLHPITSYAVYDKLKAKIEEEYQKTKEKAVILSYSQGTSFVSIFISNYSSPDWVKKYIESVVFLAPAFAGWSTFDNLVNQNLPYLPTNDEMKKSIMRMPGLHIMMPNYAVFGDTTIIYNMNKDYDQHDASHAFEFLKLKGKVDDEAERIFKAHVEKYLKVPIPEPPVPSFIVYNDGVSQTSRYSVFQHQNGKISSVYKEPGDGTVTAQGANYACGHWKSSTCKNLHDSTNHAGITTSEAVAESVFEFIEASKPIQKEEKLGLFMASGFQGSPLYATVTDPSKAPMCPSNLNHTLFYTTFYTSKNLIDNSGKYWLSNECIAMLTRVELDQSEKFVTYAPGIHLESSKFGEIDHLLSYVVLFRKAFQQENYTHFRNLFGVGYNYMLHPLMTGEVYESLKVNIEKYYNETGQRAVVTGHSQGTSFVEIFITDYVSKEWARKYVQGVIFYAPAFSGWGTYGRSVSGNYGSGFPDSLPAMKTSTQRMPGLHIMMPNEGVYGDKTVITNFPNQGDNSNASYVSALLKQLNRMDETAETIFHLTDKYRKHPLPEPPVPSLVIYNNKTSTANGYNYNSSSNSVLTLPGVGDGTVTSDGPDWACKNWKNVQCYNYNLNGIGHSNIQEKQITVDLTFDFIRNIQKFQPLNDNNIAFYSGVNDKYATDSYVNERKIDSSRLTYSATGQKPDYVLSNAFDGQTTTLWVSNITNTDKLHNSIYVNFDKNVTLEAFLYDAAYSTGSNYYTFHGFPKQLKVYATSGNKPYELAAAFVGTPTWPSTRFQFVFKEPVNCDKLKIEFVEVTPDGSTSNQAKNPVVAELIFIENIDYDIVSTVPTAGQYTESSYIAEHRVKNDEFEYSGSEGLSDRQLPNAFDDLTNTFWIAKNENTDTFHNYVDVSFKSVIELEGILYDAGYSSSSQVFHGFPKKLKIYSSRGSEELQMNTLFVGTPTWPNKQYQFVFKSPIKCDKIRLEFIEVTPESSKSGGKLCPLISNLFFIKKDDLITVATTPSETKYTNSEHMEKSKILNTQFTYSASSQRNNRVIGNAFDDRIDTFWIASTVNTDTYHNYIDVNFKSAVTLNVILYDAGYSSGPQIFHGFPLKLKIHSAIGDESLKPVALFTGTPTWPNKQYQFVFPEPLICDKIRLEFIDVTPEGSVSNNALCPLVTNLFFLQKVNTVINASMTATSDKYLNSDYSSIARIPSSDLTYDSTTSKSDRQLSNAFDDVINTFWIAQNPNNDTFHNYITVNFSDTVLLDAILIDTCYTSRQQIFFGAPKQILIYTATGDQPFQPHTRFIGQPTWPDKQYQFVFEKPVKCDKIKFEYIDLTPAEDGNLNPMVSNLYFYKAFDYDVEVTVPSTNEFVQELYLQQHRVKNDEFEYSGSEGLSDRQLPNAFDDLTNTFWIAKNENTDTFHNYVDVSFKSVIELEGILYDAGYSSSSQVFHGFPKKLKIYSSRGSEELQMNTLFVGTPTWPNKQYQFVFKSPIKCDKIRLEFIEVTPESSKSGGKLCPLISNLKLYRSINYERIEYSYAKGRFVNNDYLNAHTIAKDRFTATSSAIMSGFSIDNLFDNSNSLWIANAENTKSFYNYIEITFKNTVSLDAFIYQAGVSSSTKTFHGFPLKLLVHSSIGGEQLKAKALFTGAPEWDNLKYQFVFNEPLVCDKIRIEIIDCTPEGTKSNGALKPLCVNLFLIEDSFGVPLPTSTPFPTPSPLPQEITCSHNNRCEAEGTEEKQVNVDISFSDFNDLENQGDGGAIHLVNTEFKIDNLKITNCKSLTGGGGGVYINNEVKGNFNGHLENIKFTDCSAQYGGAVYIHSTQTKVPVNIIHCVFIGNTATLTGDCQPGDLCGGSAVFLQVRRAVLSSNTFKESTGDGPVLKIVNTLKSKRLSSLIKNNEGLVSISSCKFEINQFASCCLFYVADDRGVHYDLNDSVFTGKLRNGAHYIDEFSLSKTAPKLLVRTCKFASGWEDSFNTQNRDAISIDLKNQIFFYKEKDSEDAKSDKLPLKLVVSLVVPLAAIIILVLIVIIVMKRNKNIASNDNDEELNDVL